MANRLETDGAKTKSTGTARGTSPSRDQVQCRILLDLMGGEHISSEAIRQRYYQDLSTSSFHKTFQRDRAALEAKGIHMVERTHGLAKTWTLDTKRTLADMTSVSTEDARVVAALLRLAASDPSVPHHGTLGEAVARIGLSSCAGPMQESQGSREPSPTLATILEGIGRRKPVSIAYQSLTDDEPVRRTMCVWGLFSIGDTTYAVGPRTKAGAELAMRTYNLSRATSAEVLGREPSYEIPEDFRVSDWRLLPFEIGIDHVPATFHVPQQALSGFLQLARRRGTMSADADGGSRWEIVARDVKGCARWAIAAGIYPLAPASLVEAWESLLEVTQP